MAFINEYPYSDFNEYNMDWIIKTVKDLSVAWAETKTEWGDMQTEWTNYKNYIDNYFENLDISQEINDKIDQMASDGYFYGLFNTLFRSDIITKAGEVTSDWISANLMQEVGYVIDKSLSVSDAAADAKISGDFIHAATDAELLIYTNGYISTGNVIPGNIVDLTVVGGGDTATFCHVIDSCSPGDMYCFNGQGGYSPRLWAFTDENYKLINKENAAVLADQLIATAPSGAAYMISNIEIAGKGACIKNPFFTRVETNENEIYMLKNNFISPTNNVIDYLKELYIPEMDHTIYGIEFFIGIQSSGTGKYFSEIRLYLDNGTPYVRIALNQGYDVADESVYVINENNLTVVPFENNIVNGVGTLKGYIVYDVSSLSAGTRTRFNNVSVNDVTNLFYAPFIRYELENENTPKRTKSAKAMDHSIGAANSYQAPDQFKENGYVKVYVNGVLVDPGDYTLYKQGKIVFNNAVTYDPEDITFTYDVYEKNIRPFENDLSENCYGLQVYEQNVTNTLSYVSDPAGGASDVLQVSFTDTIIDPDVTLARTQLMKEYINATELTEEVDIYIPQELLDAMVTYPNEIRWFALGSLWCPYGSRTSATSNKYSGSANSFELWKSDAADTHITYHIRSRKRVVNASQIEEYTLLSDADSNFYVKGNEWIHIKKEFKLGNPGSYIVTITDSDGTHQLISQADGISDIAYLGVPDPEDEASIYGASVNSVIPYRTCSESDAIKLYMSKDLCNYIISENGAVTVYYKNYKAYGIKAVNTF